MCEFLGLTRSEELQFLELARPDLGFVLSGRNSPASDRRWRSLHMVANRLRQSKGPRNAVQTAVEILHASFGPDLSAFAVEVNPLQTARVALVIGRPMDAANLPDALFTDRAKATRGELSQRTFGDRQVAYAPMYCDTAAFGGIGLASIPGAGLRPGSLPFLLVVAALLETNMNSRA